MKKTYTIEEFNQFCEQNQEHGFEGEVSYDENTQLYTIDDTPNYKLINNNAIAELKQKLFDTDYVINKITEAQLLGNSVSAILSQYKDIIDQRQA